MNKNDNMSSSIWATMTQYSIKWLAELLNLAFPPRCPACLSTWRHPGLRADFLCPDCLDDLNPIVGPICLDCGSPFGCGEQYDHLCGECLVSPKRCRPIRCVLEYQGLIREAINRFKYGKDISLAQPLGRILGIGLLVHFGLAEVDVIIPVPLHINRLRERQFNQSYLLAGYAAGYAGLNEVPLLWPALKKIRTTSNQAGLDAWARRRNVRGAFQVPEKWQQQIRGKRIILIDDVCTTGSTLDECAGTLLTAGAAVVSGLSLCRTMDRDDRSADLGIS
ncbi:MAG: ComF family protein [Deltaproteobacteria bacterium]|nr:ComF family protein [Deltaproteobacteria bacterium]